MILACCTIGAYPSLPACTYVCSAILIANTHGALTGGCRYPISDGRAHLYLSPCHAHSICMYPTVPMVDSACLLHLQHVPPQDCLSSTYIWCSYSSDSLANVLRWVLLTAWTNHRVLRLYGQVGPRRYLCMLIYPWDTPEKSLQPAGYI